MPFGDASVDAVLCAQVYEHVPDAERLFAEIYRVLRPGGIVFFSAPNWLFPIEPHYFLPFLHWLSPQWAARYLRGTGLGTEYYERSQPVWTLRAMLRRFEIVELTPALMQTDYLVGTPWLRDLCAALPAAFWRAAVPVLPNFNWLLRKPGRK
jgi:SAM-dependent methyltransferase